MLRWKNKGFLLLEVLLAVTILSLGLVLVLRSFVSSLKAIKISQDILVANLLLEQKIWQKQQELARGAQLSFLDEDGSFSAPFESFSYRISFTKEGDLPLLYRTTFQVLWQRANKKHSRNYLTYLRGQEE